MDLESPVQFVKGVGPQRAESLAKLGVKTAEDLLLHLPMRYEDRRQFVRVAWLRPHRGLAGATPAESMLGLRPAHLDAVTPPRGRPGEAVEVSPPFEFRYLGPDRSLPYLLRKAA